MLILFFMIRQKVIESISEQLVSNFTLRFYPWLMIIIKLLLNILFSILIGLEHLLGEIKKDGSWHFNREKLLIVCLPLFIFSLSEVIYYLPLSFLVGITTNIFTNLIIDKSGTVNLLQILLGYNLITSMYKDNIFKNVSKKTS